MLRRPSSERLLRALLLGVVACLAVRGLFAASWFESHEAASYPARVVEVLQCWEDGMPSARWFPDLAGGRGYPFLSFYAPGLFFAAAALAKAGLGVAGGLKAVTILAALLGTVGAYRLARMGCGSPCALVAASLYTHAPYLLRDLWVRGDLAEYLALGILPWAIRAVIRLALGEASGTRAILSAAGWVAAVALTHNVAGLLAGGALAIATMVALAPAGPERGRRFAATVLAGVVALLLSAFFWVPALAERGWVRLDALRSGIFDVNRNFVGFADLLKWEGAERVFVPGSAEEMAFGLGAALVVLPTALLALRQADAGRRLVVALGAALLLAGVVMATPLSRPLYGSVPLLLYVGFPWRFLSLASLGAALLGAAGLAGLLSGRPRLRVAVCGVVCCGTVVVAQDLSRPVAPLDLTPRLLDPVAYRSGDFTATSADEYLPVWVTASTEPPFHDGVWIDGRARLRKVERLAARWTMEIETTGPATVVLREYFYPGWEGVDRGRAVPVRPVQGSGFVAFDLPAGEWREVSVRLHPRSARRTARCISALTALVALVALSVSFRRSLCRRPTAGPS
ncbi:MAG: 6-pyruvoyl-tetrahydropterin synthase-related protein [Gemmatimonadota bacterium]|nr:6-pyruvoyl-tetrahydropterin synthase-related protein [Gemmatimonadota bacterium]